MAVESIRPGTGQGQENDSDLLRLLRSLDEIARVNAEHIYQTHTAPLIEHLSRGLVERRALAPVIQHWKDTRLEAWRQPLGPQEHELALAIDGGYQEYSIGRVGDEVVHGIEDTWLLFHLLISAHGTRKGQLAEIDEAKGTSWVLTLGPGFRTDNKSIKTDVLQREATLLATYNEQYREFAATHRKALQPLAAQSLTPGTSRRTIFNAILDVGYGFRPERRAGFTSWEAKLGPAGVFIRSRRETLENLWIRNAAQIPAP